jgi:hypothetical protein
MSTNSTANADKLARIEAMKAKKAQNDASRGLSLGSTGADNRSKSTNGSLSRARVTAKILGPARPGERCTYVDAKVSSIEGSSLGGKMLMPATAQGSLFSVLPLTDELGDYPCKYDDKYRKTTERKPLELGEAGITTIKILNGPKGPVDWATPLSLFPGKTIVIEGAAGFPIFKLGVCIAGKYSDDGQSVAQQAAMDYEIPSLSFYTIANDTSLAQRNMMLSVGTGGYNDAWSLVNATDSTKQYAMTALSNERSAMLSPAGSWMTAMAKVGTEGDAHFSKEVLTLTTGLQAGAAFQSSEGLGVDYRVASHGPTIIMPVYSLGTEMSLGDGLPGDDGNAGKVMLDEPVSQLPFFEGVMAQPPQNQVFGSCYKKGTERASGGPWLKLPINTYTMAPASESVIELSTFTLMPSLMSLPAHLGSKNLETIKTVVTSFLPLTNFAVAFQADRQNITTNIKASESWDCRIPVVELHSALLKHGLELDVDAALDHFKDKPIDLETPETAKCFTTSPKPFLASGFTLLNENADARNKIWLESQAVQMEKIAAATSGAKGKFTIEIRAVNPVGFEEHKKTLSDLAEVDLVNRFENVGGDWPIYALLVPAEGAKNGDSDDLGGPAADSSSDEEEEIKHTKKKKKKQQLVLE